ncbi:hypothetical protein [Allorhodopirellula solitaria]|uniref:Uncharacterized protein n=1 Tax=Allorhodopirellula solitaria TaxID=2527987 RepID=A0A5C5WQD6_9BACT|nr:hypothetical protein [Allorhodopirellula solitaria]TWT52253.1 hypothetical protein CA85_50330 [Allorhodopirellula solitaria]
MFADTSSFLVAIRLHTETPDSFAAPAEDLTTRYGAATRASTRLAIQRVLIAPHYQSLGIQS